MSQTARMSKSVGWPEGLDEEGAALGKSGKVRRRHGLDPAARAALRALDEAGWARSGTHATCGALDVAGLLLVAVDHDNEHGSGVSAS